MNLDLSDPLDTNILSDLARDHPQGVAAKKIAVVGENAICGLHHRRCRTTIWKRRKRNSLLDLVIKWRPFWLAMLVVPVDVPTDRECAKLRHLLESSGNSIGPNDLLIAAQARANGQILVTNNVSEFTRCLTCTVSKIGCWCLDWRMRF